MNNNLNIENNHTLTAEAFGKQSIVFDELYNENPIIQYKRKRVRTHVEQFLKPSSQILELNAGTGEDAIYFAQQGHDVHATDIATGMLQQLFKKVSVAKLNDKISVEECSFESLETLEHKGPYDYIFSNFAGLNCTGNFKNVLLSLNVLLKPGGFISMVILPPFCLWELALAVRGNFKAAFRRFNSKRGVAAHIEGVYFTCWYYKPSFILEVLKNDFDLQSIEGLCTIVPPSYFERFPNKHPKIFSFLKRLEEKYKRSFLWKGIGDYYIITLKKNSGECYSST